MAKNSVNLFLNALSIFNQDRYKADPAVAARFANLTEADVVLSDRDLDDETDVLTFSVKSSTRAWSGITQSFNRANLAHPKVITSTIRALDGVTDQASFLDAIKFIDTAGVYLVPVPELNGASALLVVHAPIDEETPAGEVEAATRTAVRAILDPALLYTLDAASTVTTTVGSTYQFADDFLKGVVYHAPVGAAMLVIPPTDYGALDSAYYQDTL